MPDGGAPVEHAAALWRLSRPQHPGGEDAVEERLHQGRVKETRALRTLEPDPERLLQGRTDGAERRRVPRPLDPGKAVSGVGSQRPSQVLRIGQRRLVRQRPRQILAEPPADLACRGTRLLEEAREFRLRRGHAERLQLHLVARCVTAHELELAQVRRQHELVERPVAVDLLPYLRRPQSHLR